MNSFVNKSCSFFQCSFKRLHTNMVKLFVDFFQRISLFQQRKNTCDGNTCPSNNRHTADYLWVRSDVFRHMFLIIHRLVDLHKKIKNALITDDTFHSLLNINDHYTFDRRENNCRHLLFSSFSLRLNI